VRLRFAAFILGVIGCLPLAQVAAAPSQAMGYTPKYGDDFSHFDYVNPNAPRGGTLWLGEVGSFDSLNPYLLKGRAGSGISSLIFETLMASSLDEPFSQYGLLAEDVELAADRLSVTFRLRAAARFSHGEAVTANDVCYSFNTLRSSDAHPHYRLYWADIDRCEAIAPLTVRFIFVRENPELHLIAGQIPIFSPRWGEGKPFRDTVLDVPIGSGPYRLESYNMGRQILFQRDPDYWGDGLAVRRGMYNFDRVGWKYYRDATVELEAFKAGEFDFIPVYNAKQWARDYSGPRFRSGELIRAELDHANNAGMQGFIFNTRRPLFQDRRVRRAIALAMDFEWSNRQLFYNQYQRCDSYFSNSELASQGPPSEAELALLLPWRDQIDPRVLESPWLPPHTDPPSSLRANLREAQALLAEAGWRYDNGRLFNSSGEPLRFEVMLAQKAFERILAPFARNLERLGITIDYRTIDIALYQRRMDKFDFDMTVATFGQSQSPGNELYGMFHSRSADEEGTRNLIGLRDPVVDALVEHIVFAEDRAALITAARALDRLLLWGEYLVPNWYIGLHRIAYRHTFAQPATLPRYYDAESWAIATWWDRRLAGSQ
jgi:microcin C transport system substrate-binding protein